MVCTFFFTVCMQFGISYNILHAIIIVDAV